MTPIAAQLYSLRDLDRGHAPRELGRIGYGAGTLPIADILAAAPHARRIVELDHCGAR
jgi:hypothetical protein